MLTPTGRRLVLVAGRRRTSFEHVADPEGRIRVPPVLGEGEAGPGRGLLGLERAGGRGRASRFAAGGEAEDRRRGMRGRRPGWRRGGAGEADGLRAEEQRRGEPLPLLSEVGGVLLGLEHRAVHVQSGDVAALLPLELEIGEPLGVAHRVLERPTRISAVATSEMRSRRSNQRWRSVSTASYSAASRAARLRSLAWTALGDLERLVEGEGVVGDVLELVEPGRIGGPDGQRAPLEIEARIGEDLGADDVGGGLAELRARGDEVR